MQEKKFRKKKSAPAWLITYGDMVTLLLCLFIMLYATGKATPQEIQLILSAFNNNLGFFTGGQTLSKGRLEELGLNLESLPSQTRSHSLSEAKKEAKSIFQPEIESQKVRVTENERGIVISLVSADYFTPGSALLTPEIKKVLRKAVYFIQEIDRYLRIEGHSTKGEDEGISSNQGERVYINSWDLSSARSINVANYLQKADLNPSRMQTVGFGSYRPLSIVGDGTPEANAYNRRIDLVILNFKKTKRTKNESNYGLPKTRIPGSEQHIAD